MYVYTAKIRSTWTELSGGNVVPTIPIGRNSQSVPRRTLCPHSMCCNWSQASKQQVQSENVIHLLPLHFLKHVDVKLKRIVTLLLHQRTAMQKTN